MKTPRKVYAKAMYIGRIGQRNGRVILPNRVSLAFEVYVMYIPIRKLTTAIAVYMFHLLSLPAFTVAAVLAGFASFHCDERWHLAIRAC
jgi:hypothetical protein